MNVKCAITNREHISFCDSLVDKLSPEPNAHKKGFTVIVISDLAKDEHRTVGVAYKKSSTDRGSMLNYCPYCGEKILNT